MGIGSDTLASLKVIYNPAQMKLFPDTPFHMFSPRLVEMGSRFPHWVFTQKSNSGRENRERERGRMAARPGIIGSLCRVGPLI